MAKRSYKSPAMKSQQVFREAVLACQVYNNYETQPACQKNVSGVCEFNQFSSTHCSAPPQPNVS